MRQDEIGAIPLAGTGVAVTAIAILHVEGWLLWPLDPLRHTVSDYVALPGGYPFLALAAGALAFVGAHLTRVAARAGASRAVIVLLAGWSLAMVIAGAFPTNAPGLPPDLISEVHRWAGAWIFASLPLAVLLLARGPAVRQTHQIALGRLAVLTGALSAAFLLSHVPIVIGGSPGFLPLGGVERVLYGMVILLLIATGRALSPCRPGFGQLRPQAHSIRQDVRDSLSPNGFARDMPVDGGAAPGRGEPGVATGGAA